MSEGQPDVAATGEVSKTGTWGLRGRGTCYALTTSKNTGKTEKACESLTRQRAGSGEGAGARAVLYTYWFVQIHDPLRLRDADAKRAEEDVPEVEAQLVAHVRHDVRGPVFLVQVVDVGAVNAEGPLLVGVGRADADGNGEDGDVHHAHQAELHGGVHEGQVEGRGAGVPRRGGLEQGGQDAGPHRQVVDGGVFQVQDDDQQHVDEVQHEDDAEEDPGRPAREEQGVAPARVVEEELEVLPRGRVPVDGFRHDPDDEPQEHRVDGVPCEGEKGHDEHRPGGILERRHRVGRQGEAKVVDHGLGRVEGPPRLALSVLRKPRLVLRGSVQDPRQETNDPKEVEPEEVTCR